MTNRAAARRLLGGGLLALASTAPPGDGAATASASPAPRPRGTTAFVSNGRIRTARAAFGGPASAASATSTSSSTTRLAGGLSDLHSLGDVARNPDLFPIASGYVRTLSEVGAGAAGAPSAEEFLAQLSAEVRRASSRTDVAGGAGGAAAAAAQSSSSSSSSFLDDLAGSALRTSAAAVAGAAAAGRGYDAAMSAYADYAYASAASTAVASTPTLPGGGGGASESFAAWRSQGVANSLRDLAASVPVVDRPDANEYYSTLQGMSDSFGADGLYLVDNAVADAGAQQVVPAMQDFADGASANLNGGADAVAAASSPASDYLAAGAADPVPLAGAADPALVPGASDALSETLSDRLADGRSAADVLPSSPKSPFLGDYIQDKLGQVEFPNMKDKLDHVELPKMSNPFSEFKLPTMSIQEKLGEIELPNIKDKLDRVELPKVSNPFSEIELPKVSIKDKLDRVELPRASNPFSELHLPKSPASLQEAVSSVREALPTAADVSNSLETLSDRVGKAGAAARDGVTKAAEFSNSYSGSFQGHENRVGEAGAVGARALGEAARAGAARVAGMAPPKPTMAANEGMAAAPALPQVELPHFQMPDFSHPPSLPNVADASLSDVGNGVVHSVQFIGGILVKFVDLILGAVAGTSVASLLVDVQTSVTSTINGAIHAVLSTIDNAANMSIKEILQHLTALLFAITDVLLKVANAIVYLLSGRDGENWALQASTTVEEAGSQLLAAATHTYDEVTHESLAQLAHGVGDYSHHVGNELLTLVGTLSGAVADGATTSLDADALDRVATAVQTALTL